MPSPRSSRLATFVVTIAAACGALSARQAAGAETGAETESQYRAAGMYETGLTAEMPDDAKCPAITLGFAARLDQSGTSRAKRHGTFHAGVDWALPEGTPIVAIADGRVVERGDDLRDSRGNFVVIDHGSPQDGIRSSYVHLSGFNVEPRQAVKKGQVIGFVGKTGTGATHVHLHLNVLGKDSIRIGDRKWRYRYDYLQFLSGDMTPIDPAGKRPQKVKIAYMDPFGNVHPPGAEVIWPFICERTAD